MVKVTMKSEGKKTMGPAIGMGVKKGKVVTNVKKRKHILRVAKIQGVKIKHMGANSDLVKTINGGRKAKIEKMGPLKKSERVELKKMESNSNLVKNIEEGNILRVAKKNQGVEIMKTKGRLKRDLLAMNDHSNNGVEELKTKMSTKSEKRLMGNPAKNRTKNKDSRTLFVKLPKGFANMLVLKNLSKNIIRVNKPKNKNCCFLVFKSKAVAERALKQLQGKELPEGPLLFERIQRPERSLKFEKRHIPKVRKPEKQLSLADKWDPVPSEQHYSILMYAPKYLRRKGHIMNLHKDIIAVSRQTKKICVLHIRSLEKAEKVYKILYRDKLKPIKLYNVHLLLVRGVPNNATKEEVKAAFPGCISVLLKKKSFQKHCFAAVVGYETATEARRLLTTTKSHHILGHKVTILGLQRERRENLKEEVPVTSMEMEKLGKHIIEVSDFGNKTKLKAIKSMFDDCVKAYKLRRDYKLRAVILFSSPEQAAAACYNEELHYLKDAKLVVQSLNRELMLTYTNQTQWKKCLRLLEQCQEDKSSPAKLTETQKRTRGSDVELSPATIEEGVKTIKTDLALLTKTEAKEQATIKKSDIHTSPMKSRRSFSTPGKEGTLNQKWEVTSRSKMIQRELEEDASEMDDVEIGCTDSNKEESEKTSGSELESDDSEGESKDEEMRVRSGYDLIDDEAEEASGAELDDDDDISEDDESKDEDMEVRSGYDLIGDEAKEASGSELDDEDDSDFINDSSESDFINDSSESEEMRD